ncbi:MAG: class I SAM-dependent methyltransferase [Verrucomicrobia bacterium]|nr:class I SAM-dependent methyltransferase [Verrucomicrobiota bacterium]
MKFIWRQFFLCFIAWKVWWYFFQEERQVRLCFYRNGKFQSRDRAFKKIYRFKNPYRMNKKFLRSMGIQEVDTYGETPLTTLYSIAKQCEITSQDHFIDLGCGRGRGTFFLNDYFGCRTTGIEWNPEFVANAKKLAATGASLAPEFICTDMLSADLSKATVIYLFGTCLPDPIIEKLAESFARLPRSTKIITVSFPLSDYSKAFREIKEFTGSFPWGEGSIYLNQRTEKSTETELTTVPRSSCKTLS